MIDITKQYQTRDGRKVRILCTDGPGTYPVIGLIDGFPSSRHWASDGQSLIDYGEQATDLIEVPKVITGWVNVYRSDRTGRLFIGQIWDKKEAAAQNQDDEGPIACIQISFKEGEGL